MYKNKTISLCLPCRNEAKNLKHIIGLVPGFVDETIIVSNCSTDDSVIVARQLGVTVIEDNRETDGIGYGFAHMTAIEQASGDIIIGTDCDGTYPIEKLAEIIEHLLSTKSDFVSCSRYPLQAGTDIPFILRLGVQALNIECRLLYNIRVHDILSGMWVFRGSIKDRLDLTAGDWNLSPQIKLNAATNPDIAFREYNIPQHQRRGKTHQAYLKTGLSHLLWIFKNWLVGHRHAQLSRIFAQVIRYGFVALGALFIDVGLLYLLVDRAKMFYILAATIAYSVSMIVNYFASMAWVFTGNSRRSKRVNGLIFALVGVVGLGLTDSIMWALTTGIGVHYLIAKFLSIAVVFCWSFSARRYFLEDHQAIMRPSAQHLSSAVKID